MLIKIANQAELTKEKLKQKLIDSIVSRRIDAQFEAFKQKLREKKEADATLQHNKTLTDEQRKRRAIEWMAKDIKEFNEKNNSGSDSFEKAKEYMIGIANRNLRRTS